MAYIEPKLPQEELDALIQEFIQKKKTSPSRIDRPLTYKIHNQLFNDKQRDVNACTCMDKDTDLKVVTYVEQHYKVEEPLPVQSSVKIDFSSMINEEEFAYTYAEENNIELGVVPEPEMTIELPKRKRTTRKKKTNEEGTI